MPRTNILESGCLQDEGWSAVPFILPSVKEHAFSISHGLFPFLSKNMWISSNNTRVQIFYFDSNTTVPLQCVALVVWKAYVERMSFGWLFLGIPINFFQALIKLIASLSVWINKRFQIFLVTLDSTFTKTILRCLNSNSAFCNTKNLSNVLIFGLI